MKKLTALLLAAVLVLTCFATIACNKTVLVYLEDYDGNKTVTQVYNPDVALPKPEREGYVFGGWYTDRGLTKAFVEGTEMSSNFHLYAKWTAKSHDDNEPQTITITFHFCDGITADKVSHGTPGQPFSAFLPTGPNPTRKDYRFDGWYTLETGGSQMLSTTVVEVSMPVYAHWTYIDNNTHTTHDFGNSYFMYVKCSGCDVYGRNDSLRKYDNMFNFTTAKGNVATNSLTKCQNYIISAGNVDGFMDLFVELEEQLCYVDEQYYWASVYGDVNENFNFYSIDTLYKTIFAGYCAMFEDIDETYGDSFWNKYDGAREDCLALAHLYGDNSNSSEVDGILEQYEKAISTSSPNMTTISNLYGQLVVANNNIAKTAGYDNYMEYAYKEIYNRDYTPSQVAGMREYIKRYIAPALMTVANKMDSMQEYDSYYGYYYNFSNSTNEDFYWGLMEDSIFEDESYEYFEEVRDAVNMIGEYFGYLTSTTAGNKQISFLNAVDDLFKNGNYFTGTGEGAYTMWVPYSAQIPVVYFQASTEEDYGYDTAFTFVHEFGHYYENIYNGGLELSYDHDETQSQGDEMLFLAWLKNNLPTGVSDGFTAVELDQLFDILSNIVMSCAVDEFEQAAYTGTYNGSTITGSYGDLFATILNSYDENLGEWLNTNYWSSVVFDSAAYYISYSISALPSVELYVLAQTQSLDVARDAYFKLFTFSEDMGVMEDYSYFNVLQYCGLDNPFEKGIFEKIANFVNGLY